MTIEMSPGKKSAQGPDVLKAAGRKAVLTKGPAGLKAAGLKAAETKRRNKAEHDEMERQTKRIQELFEPVLNQITKEGLDVIGALYAINMDLVLRDATMGVPARKFDTVFNQHYDRTLHAIAEMIDKAYGLKPRA